MVNDTDHGLSDAGARQAEGLAARLATAAASTHDAAANEFIKPDVVFVSPLTRAVQTAVIGLGPMLTRAGAGTCGTVVLLPTAREKHNLGGRDTVSTKAGTSILHAVLRKLRVLYKDWPDSQTNPLGTFAQMRFDVSATEEQWWSDGHSESKPQVHVRMREFLAQLLYSPHESIIVVGHSLFFKEFVSEFMHEDFRHKEPKLAEQLSTKKLENCGVLRLELDPREGIEGKAVRHASLVLGSSLVGIA